MVQDQIVSESDVNHYKIVKKLFYEITNLPNIMNILVQEKFLTFSMKVFFQIPLFKPTLSTYYYQSKICKKTQEYNSQNCTQTLLQKVVSRCFPGQFRKATVSSKVISGALRNLEQQQSSLGSFLYYRSILNFPSKSALDFLHTPRGNEYTGFSQTSFA